MKGKRVGLTIKEIINTCNSTFCNRCLFFNDCEKDRKWNNPNERLVKNKKKYAEMY